MQQLCSSCSSLWRLCFIFLQLLQVVDSESTASLCIQIIQSTPKVYFRGAFLFAQRSWQTPSLLVSDLTQFMGKRIRLARASVANAGV